jgi:hypothetical protein
MKFLRLLGAAALASLVPAAVFAGELKADDIEVLSVIPRSPDVTPYAMSVSADGHRVKPVAITVTPNASKGAPERLATAEDVKTVTAPGPKK